MHTHLRFRTAAMFVLAATIAATPACGGDDNGPTAPVPQALLGSWVASSLMAQGTDLVTQGRNLSFHFSSDGEYAFTVTGDLLGLCDQGTSCNDWGEFTASGTQIIFDPGPGAETFSYSISGDVMTMTGNMGGSSVQGSFDRS